MDVKEEMNEAYHKKITYANASPPGRCSRAAANPTVEISAIFLGKKKDKKFELNAISDMT